MILRLSHPWKWHHTRDILDTDRPADGITEAEARRLIRGGIARPIEDVVEDLGGGWYQVPLSGGKSEKVQGLKAAVRLLRRDAR